jgi:dipeptidyl aminopeptidase/acylaminoacyl peptidase
MRGNDMTLLSVNDVLNVKEPADRVHMSISSDGKWLAFCIDGKLESKSIGVSLAVEGNTQWVCNLETGESFPIATKANSSWGGVWSPNDETLAFFADINDKAQLWIWTPSDRSLKLGSEIIVRPFFGFEKPIWTNDGLHIIVKSLPSEEVDDNHFSSSTPSINAVINNYTSKPQHFTTSKNTKGEANTFNTSWVNRYRADLSLINISTGKDRTLCSGFRPVGLAISNDGKYLAFTSCTGEERLNTQQNIFELWVVTLESNVVTNVTRIEEKIRMDYGLCFSWGLDNKTIFYTTSGPLSEGGLWSVNSQLPNSAKLEFSPDGNQFGREFDGPIPLKNGEIIMIFNGSLCVYSPSRSKEKMFTLDGREIVAVFPITNQSDEYVIVQTIEKGNAIYGFYRIDYETGESDKIFEEPNAHLPWFEGGSAYQKQKSYESISFFSQSANEPPTLKTLDVKAKMIIVESVLNEVNKDQFGISKLIKWKQGDTTLRGALLLPKNIEGKVPVVIRVYGGSMQSSNVRFYGLSRSAADNHQIFATRGYAVFLPDLPMLRSNEPAEEISIAIENALNELVKHPQIDPERIGIIGHSFGGYSALVAITRSPRFKAAVISAGIGNLISYYTKFDPPNFNYGWVEDGQANLGATLWEDKERYIRNSPLFDLHNIQVPVLIVQGTQDHICNEEAGPIFSSLNRLGKTAELILYDEDHYQGTWKEENLKDYYKRVLGWFNKYL